MDGGGVDVSWSLKEVSRISILEQFVNGLISLNQAAQSFGISLRQD